MWTLMWLLVKSAFLTFLIYFVCFAARNFMIGFKEGLREAYERNPLVIDSACNRKHRRALRDSRARMETPVMLVEQEIDVESYYEEQLRIESTPLLKVFTGD